MLHFNLEFKWPWSNQLTHALDTGGSGSACPPADAKQAAFCVAPGGAMLQAKACTKHDYAVLIVISMGVDN